MNHPRSDTHMDVTILLGSSSDMPVAEKCTKILNQFDVTYQLRVASAHRSPKFVEQIVHDAENDGCQVFIAIENDDRKDAWRSPPMRSEPDRDWFVRFFVYLLSHLLMHF